MSNKNTIGILIVSIFSLLISFAGGVYVQHSISIIKSAEPKPNIEIIKIKQNSYASILSSFDELSFAVENNKPAESYINRIRKSYYEIELFLPEEYRHYMLNSMEKAIVYLTAEPQQKESYLIEMRQLRHDLQNMLKLENI